MSAQTTFSPSDFFESLSRLHRVAERRLNAALKPHGITSAQYVLLKTVVCAPGRKTGARLGVLLNLDKTSLSRNLKILEKRAFIDRDGACGRHGRTIRITSQGLDVLAKTKQAWDTAHTEFSVSDDTVLHLADIATRLRA